MSESLKLYFAYGSNMLLERLQNRVSAVLPYGVASLPGYRMSFQKVSQDGSAKADIAEDPQGQVYGVLYSMYSDDIKALDKIEGAKCGYDRVERKVICDGVETTALMYKAPNNYINTKLLPYKWYVDLVVKGARENDLPMLYVSDLEVTPFKMDTGRPERDQ